MKHWFILQCCKRLQLNRYFIQNTLNTQTGQKSCMQLSHWINHFLIFVFSLWILCIMTNWMRHAIYYLIGSYTCWPHISQGHLFSFYVIYSTCIIPLFHPSSLDQYLHNYVIYRKCGIYEQLVLKQLAFMIMRHRQFYHIEVIRPLNQKLLNDS